MHFRQFHHTYQMSRLAYRGLVASSRSHLLVSELSRAQLFRTSLRYAATDGGKVENTLKMLKEDLLKQHEEEAKRLKLVPAEGTAVKKLSLKEKIVHELKHYYHGFRLLALETRLSAKYMWRVLRGATLNRRERQQLIRTVSDLFRLVPFSIFIIVPFMELALPIFIKLFPNMLPSTFQERSKEEEKLRKQVKVKVEMAKFLQDTIEELALERRTKLTEMKDSKAVEFAAFIKKVRNEGGYVSNTELFKFSKLFEDELTLDNLSMGQLRSLCRLMTIQPLGSPEILRFQLNMKLRELKADDKQIAAEGGVDALSTLDLQQACRARGMRALGLSEERLRDQLKQWLELSLNDKVPPSLLLLSRTLYLPEDISFTDRLKSLVQNLPEGIAEQTRQKLTELEGGKVDHKARIDLIKQIEDAISKEKAMAAEKKADEEKQKKVVEEKEKSKQVAEAAAAVLSAAAEEGGLSKAAADAHMSMEAVKEDLQKAISEVTAAKSADSKSVPTSKEEPKKEVEKDEDIKVDPKDLSSIEQILVGGPIHEAKHDIIGLKEKVIEHTEDLIEINALDGAFSETKVAKRLRSRLNSMIENVDELVSKLEEEKRHVDESIADPAVPDSARLKVEKQVRIKDLVASLHKIQAGNIDDAQKERIERLLKSVDADSDGVIDADLVLEVIALMEKHKDVPISPSQMTWMIEMLKKEDQVEALGKAAMETAQLDEPITAHAATTEPEPISDEKEKEVEVPSIDPKITAQLQHQKTVNGGSTKKPEVPP